MVPKVAPERAVFEIQAFLVFAIGGGLGNMVEIVFLGEVTDFFGVHLPNGGVYSAGDVANTVGISLIPLAAFALTDRYALARAATAYLAVDVLGFILPGHVLLVIGATTVALVATPVALLSKLRGRRWGVPGPDAPT